MAVFTNLDTEMIASHVSGFAVLIWRICKINIHGFKSHPVLQQSSVFCRNPRCESHIDLISERGDQETPPTSSNRSFPHRKTVPHPKIVKNDQVHDFL
jgi:hypothetical protein